MTARERLLEMLRVPASDPYGGDWLDLVEGRPGSRGRLQDVWQSRGGSGSYDAVLAVGDRLGPYVPEVLGGTAIRDFYEVDRRLALVPGETVLDVACGPGTLTRRLAAAVGPDGLVIAADLSAPMLDRAARVLHEPQVALARMDAMDLPLRDASVDAICCSLCLHLVPDLETALAELARVLRPGGRIAVAVPVHGWGPFRVLTDAFERWTQARLFGRGEPTAALARHGFVGMRERRQRGTALVDAALPA